MLYNAYGKATLQQYYRTPGPIVSSTPDDYTSCAMKSSPESKCSKNWLAPDKGDWWLSDERYSEPNGDYDAGHYLESRTGEFNEDRYVFNDHNRCDSCGDTGTLYLCMTLAPPPPTPPPDSTIYKCFCSSGSSVTIPSPSSPPGPHVVVVIHAH